MKIIYLAIGRQSLDVGNLSHSCSVFGSYDEYTKCGIDAAGFVLECDSEEKGLSIVKNMRRSTEIFLLPIFLHTVAGEEIELITDGAVVSLEDALEKAKEFHEEKVKLKHEQVEYAESTMLRVLAYLYLRPDRIIQPLQRWTNPFLYSYPLIDVLAAENQDALEVLSNLKNHRFIRSVDFIDRVRHCPRCNFSHYNFIRYIKPPALLVRL